MFRQINQILLQHGYQNITLNISGLYFHLCRQGKSGYAVITIDETSGNLLTREQFFHISEQIRDYLIRQDCRTTSFLYLLVTNHPQSSHRLFSDHDCYWIISPQTDQFLVYENQNPFFEPLRRSLEQLFPITASDDSSRRTGYRASAPDTPVFSDSTFQLKSLLTCSTYLVVVNIIIFLFTDFSSAFQHYDWLDSFALSWQEVFQKHQYYRLFTSLFLHSDLDHIFNNMLVLLIIGRYLENYVGQIRYLIIYFSSGIIAGCTSMVYNMIQNNTVVSIGASGAIFGLMGALLTIVLLKKGRRQELNVRQILFMVLFSLYGGFTSQGVDNAAHVGGFLGGILITAILCIKERRNTRTCSE